MANHKSAIKRYRQSLKRNTRNRQVKSEIYTFTKKVLNASKDEAENLFKQLQSRMDKAARKGVINRKKVARNLGKIARSISAK